MDRGTLARLVRPMVSVGLFLGILLLGANQMAWATPAQSPYGQTVPSPTAPTPDDDDDDDEEINAATQTAIAAKTAATVAVPTPIILGTPTITVTLTATAPPDLTPTAPTPTAPITVTPTVPIPAVLPETGQSLPALYATWAWIFFTLLIVFGGVAILYSRQRMRQ